MKKPFFNIFVLILCGVLSLPLFASCDQEEKSEINESSAEESSVELIPHETYEKGALSFAYPESYVYYDKKNVSILQEKTTEKTITVSSQDKTSVYREMTIQKFWSLIRDPFEYSNIKAKNFSHRTEKNANGVEVTMLFYDVTYKEMDAKQTIFAVNSLYRTHVIIMTTPEEDTEAVNFIFDSFKVSDETLEYKNYRYLPIFFEYPKTYSYPSKSEIRIMQESYTGNNIAVAMEKKTDRYSEMTEEKFNLLIKPQLEAQGMVVSDYSYSKETNPEGVEMAVLSYNTSVNGINMTQKLFCLNSEENTYIITLTQVEKDEETIKHVFETIKIIE